MTDLLERTPVESSNIVSIGFDYDGDPVNNTVTLQVEFRSGAIWNYEKVPAEVAEEFLGAESVGRFFYANIRGKYVEARVEIEEDEE